MSIQELLLQPHKQEETLKFQVNTFELKLYDILTVLCTKTKKCGYSEWKRWENNNNKHMEKNNNKHMEKNNNKHMEKEGENLMRQGVRINERTSYKIKKLLMVNEKTKNEWISGVQWGNASIIPKTRE